jgi:hypothetical protein
MRMPRRFGGDERPKGGASIRRNGVLGQTWRARYEPPVPSFRRHARGRAPCPGRNAARPRPSELAGWNGRGALQTRDRSNLWRSRICGAPRANAWSMDQRQRFSCAHAAPRPGHGALSRPRRQCGGSEVRIILAATPRCGLLNQSHTGSIKLLVPFDSEVRKRECRRIMRTSESGH